MIINHNMQAINAHRQMGANAVNSQKSMEKLSSGLRINRAGDDAAGLAISEKMRGQIRGLDQAGRNAQDGISLIQTAEGALNETHSILQRMRELSVQSANDTNTDDDRAELQKEITQLTEEIDRIATTTEFNTQALLDGSKGTKPITHTAGKEAVTAVAGEYGINVGLANGTATLAAAMTINIDGSEITLEAGKTAAELATAISAKVGANYTVAASGGDIKLTQKAASDTQASVTGTTFTTTTTGVAAKADAKGEYEIKINAGKDITIDGEKIEGSEFTNVDELITKMQANTTLNGKYTMSKSNEGNLVLTQKTGSTTGVSVQQDNGVSLQVGANENQTINFNIEAMNSDALGTTINGEVKQVSDINLSTKSGAQEAIQIVDGAIKSVSASRSDLGAIQNRLEHTINNLGTSSENLTAAESRIRDVDMAKEMMNFTKTNVLNQAAQAMLAQANQQPNQVLQLLR